MKYILILISLTALTIMIDSLRESSAENSVTNSEENQRGEALQAIKQDTERPNSNPDIILKKKNVAQREDIEQEANKKTVKENMTSKLANFDLTTDPEQLSVTELEELIHRMDKFLKEERVIQKLNEQTLSTQSKDLVFAFISNLVTLRQNRVDRKFAQLSERFND